MGCDQFNSELLLLGDESSQAFRALNAHVERCSHCQTRLRQEHNDANWRDEAQRWLKGMTDAELQVGAACRTSVHLAPELPDDASLEIETAPLDFLEPPKHPELLGAWIDTISSACWGWAGWALCSRRSIQSCTESRQSRCWRLI